MKLKLISTLALALALSACGGSSAPSSTASMSQPAPAQEAASGGASNGATGGAPALQDGASAPQGSGNTTPSQQGFARLVIKTADMTLQVENVRDAEAAVRAKVSQLDGYVVQAQTSGADESMTTSITFRVPAERFDEALNGVQGLAKQVLARSIKGDDVTEEFVDLQSRKQTLEATRNRLLTLLSRAETVDQALLVNTSLTDIQGQIDQVAGREKYLSQSAALSTITVTLSPVPLAEPIVSKDGWQPLAVAADALRGLVGFGQGLVSIAIVILVWAPVWLPLVLLVLWLRRRVRNRARPQPTTAA